MQATASSDQNRPPEHADETDLNALFQELASGPEGLASVEAKNRLAQYGPNALEEKKVSPSHGSIRSRSNDSIK